MADRVLILWATYEGHWRPEPLAVISESTEDCSVEVHQEIWDDAIARHRQYVDDDTPVKYVEVWRDVEPPTDDEIAAATNQSKEGGER